MDEQLLYSSPKSLIFSTFILKNQKSKTRIKNSNEISFYQKLKIYETPHLEQ